MIGRLYHCLRHRKLYEEQTTFPPNLPVRLDALARVSEEEGWPVPAGERQRSQQAPG
jgi:hypothetical protein